jgi:hypothetical protein
VNLHPQEEVDRFVETHEHAFALVWGCLDEAVPRAFAKWDLEFPDRALLPGDTLCGDVRALFWPRVTLELHDQGLRVVPRGSSYRLSDGLGRTVRVRRHPRNATTATNLPVTTPPIDTLFGVDYDAVAFELAVLWTPNRKTESLGGASLAAVHDLDGSPDIYGRTPLPRTDLTIRDFGTTPPPPPPGDFEEFLGGEAFGDDSPA